jgi:hypothetical protein
MNLEGWMKKEPVNYPTRNKSLIGAAGVHFVAAQLSLRGLIALPTTRNTAGVDVIVVNMAGTWQANLQVKTSRSRVGFWPIGAGFASWRGPNNYYVFVRYNPKTEGFEAFLESSEHVASAVEKVQDREKTQGIKEWAPCYYPRAEIDRLRRQWETFGPQEAAVEQDHD